MRDIGVVGLGAMGRNLALHPAEKGFSVVVHDPWPEARATWDRAAPGLGAAEADLASFAAHLARPRRVLVLLKAGEPTDAFLDALLPHLDPGDVVADLGNAHFADTQRREARLAAAGVHFLGIGISGGAEGARTGAAFMAGGDAGAWDRISPVIMALAARADDGTPCGGRFGSGGAGHFVKMIHNGIEYAEMQALAEIYMVLRDGLGLDVPAMAARFEAWNQGLGASFLTGLAADVLRTPDPDGGWMIDRVLDEAGQKGTGRWTVEAALELGVPAPTLAEAVFARGLSAQVAQRQVAAGILAGPAPGGMDPALADSLGDALLAARIAAFAQGFAILDAASRAHGWNVDRAAVAEVWRAGCILRGALLPEIAAAYRTAAEPVDLMAAPNIASRLADALPGWRRAVAAAQQAGIPVPVLASALAAYDGWRSRRLGADLIAAQRDAFGAHGFRRRDREGSFHAAWGRDGSRPA